MVVSADIASPGAVYAVFSSATVLTEFNGVAFTDTEFERADRLHGQTRADFFAGHQLVRHCVARLTGSRPAEVVLEQSCDVCGRPGHGRPRIAGRPELHLSLAHSRGVVAAAAGWSPLGIDLEALPLPPLRIEEVAATLSPAELAVVRSAPAPTEAFARYWVRKEALVKLGAADLDGLGQLDLSGVPLPDPAVRRRPHRFGDWQILDWSEAVPDALGALVTGPGADLSQFWQLGRGDRQPAAEC